MARPAFCTRCGGALAHEDEVCRCGGRSAAWGLLDAEQRDDRLRRRGVMFCHDHGQRDGCYRKSTAEERGWCPSPAEALELIPAESGGPSRRMLEAEARWARIMAGLRSRYDA